MKEKHSCGLVHWWYAKYPEVKKSSLPVIVHESNKWIAIWAILTKIKEKKPGSQSEVWVLGINRSFTPPKKRWCGAEEFQVSKCVPSTHTHVHTHAPVPKTRKTEELELASSSDKLYKEIQPTRDLRNKMRSKYLFALKYLNVYFIGRKDTGGQMVEFSTTRLEMWSIDDFHQREIKLAKS